MRVQWAVRGECVVVRAARRRNHAPWPPFSSLDQRGPERVAASIQFSSFRRSKSMIRYVVG